MHSSPSQMSLLSCYGQYAPTPIKLQPNSHPAEAIIAVWQSRIVLGTTDQLWAGGRRRAARATAEEGDHKAPYAGNGWFQSVHLLRTRGSCGTSVTAHLGRRSKHP